VKPVLLQSALLSRFPGIGHAFSTRVGGVSDGPYASLNLASATGDVRERVLENRRLLCEAAGAPFPPAIPKQVLGSEVVTVGELDREADAIVANEPGRSTLTLSADCVLILLYDPVRRAIGNVHSSRHGARGEIVKKALARMTSLYGTRAADVVAAIGPSIGPCCYEVRDDIVRVWRGFGDRFLLERHGRIHLDLWTAVRTQLAEAGVGEIDLLGVCTKCDPDRFYSYRRDGEKSGRFGALLWLRQALS
jgi:polyphenol oxidase